MMSSRSQRRGPAVCVALIASVTACTAAPPGQPTEERESAVVSSAAGDVVVTWSDVHQTIRGFGASSAFFGAKISEDDADWFFVPTTGIGLSLLRIQIGVPADTQSDGSEPSPATPVATAPELATAQQAVARGARVWAAAWTPPPAWKTTNNKSGSGTGYASNKLMPDHYADYATYLADFVDYLAANGVRLMAISPQNEPDYVATWDGAQWTGPELTTFVGKNLGPEFAKRGITTAIAVPDAAHWNSLPAYVDPLMADAAAKGYASIIATHPYPTGSKPVDLTYSKPRDNGKDFWETEVSQENLSGDTPDPSITSALTMAKMIHDHLTVANMNAWNWWALTIDKDNLTDSKRMNPALLQDGVRFKRGYALGNFAKFVRPDFQRVGVTGAPASLRVSAYRDSSHVAIVVINDGASAVMQKFWLDGGTFGTVTPWVTSASDNLAAKAPITATNNFTFSVPAKSVVTFANWDAAKETPGLVVGGAGGMTGGGGRGAGGTTGAGGAAAGGTTGVGGVGGVGGVAGVGGPAGASGGATGTGSGGRGGSTTSTGTGGGPNTGSGGLSGGASGGAAVTGGNGQSGGSSSSGGTRGGSGGMPGGSGGSVAPSGTGGHPAVSPGGASSSGCACAMGSDTGRSTSPRAGLLLVGVGLLFARRRRPRRYAR